MNVLCLAATDCAEQSYLLAKGMRDVLGWEAKSLVLSETYLQYRTDWILERDVDEIIDFIKSADLFIFQDIMFSLPIDRAQKVLDKRAKKNTTIIDCMGSLARIHIPQLLSMQIDGWKVVPPMSDPTIAGYLVGVPFENVMMDFSRIVELIGAWKEHENEARICHAPTKSMKGTSRMDRLMEEIDAEFVVIQNKSWEDAMKIKNECNITLDSFGDQSYGLNCLEGLYMGHSVISNISPWCYSLHPDLPIDSVWEMTDNEIIELTSNIVELHNNQAWNQQNIKWVFDNFNMTDAMYKWERYLDWAGMVGERS